VLFPITKRKKIIEYERKILEFIKQNNNGVTITDIAVGTQFSRNTVSKYVSILGIKKKIFSREIGAYKLYFSAEEISFPKIFSLAYYKGILSGLKSNFPNSEEAFKDIGRNCYDYIDFSLGPMVSKELRGFKVSRLVKVYYTVFGQFYPSYDITQPTIEISIEKMENNKQKTILKFNNSEFIGPSGEFSYHAYIMAGLIETLWKKEVGKKIYCNVESIHPSDKREDSFYVLSIVMEKDLLVAQT